MTALEGGHNALYPGQRMKRAQGLIIIGHHVIDPTDIFQPGMLRPYARVIQPSRHRVRVHDLPVGILHQIGAVAVEHTGSTRCQRRRVLIGGDTVATGFYPVHGDVLILKKWMKQADRVGTAADAGHQRVRQTAGKLQGLRPRLAPDDTLEITHQHRIRVRPGHCADNVKGVIDIGYPVAHGFIHSVFQRARARRYRNDLRAQQLHSINIERLTVDILLTHKHLAFQTKTRGNGCGGNAMLARTGFRDDALFTHMFG